MVEIIPAILPKSFADLEAHAKRVHKVASTIQIDIVDGVYAHHKTWPYKDRSSFDTIVAQERGLPFWQDFDFEFDLMIEDPALEVMNFVHAGASRVVVHANAAGAVEGLRKLSEVREDFGAFTITTGLALQPDMQPEVLESFDTLFDYVQVMGITREGKQGEPFDRHALALIERLRRRYPDLRIQVDGGVNLDTILELVGAGANRLIAGNAIFGVEDASAAYRALYTKANRG
jgi:ribulose-phosphate 3-epimerase